MSSTYPSLPRPPPAALQDPAVTCVSVDAIVDSGAGPTTASSLSLVGGQRDAACAVVLRLRHAASAGAQGPDGSAAAFTIVSSSGGLSFAVTAAAGFDTTLSLGPLLPGSSPSPLSLQLQQGGAPVGDPVAVPATCAAAAAAPAFSVPNGTTVSSPSESLAVLFALGPPRWGPMCWGSYSALARDDARRHPSRAPTPPSAAPAGSLTVAVSSATPGAFVYVSLDGSDPTSLASDALLWAQVRRGGEKERYKHVPLSPPCTLAHSLQDASNSAGPAVSFTLSAPGCTTVLAYAARGDLEPSAVVAATYCVSGGELCNGAARAEEGCSGRAS